MPLQHSARRVFSRFLSTLGILIAVAGAPVALAASGEEPEMSGQEVYNNVCIACHTPPGIGGAPALGDAEAWAPRVAKGMDTLIDNALNGYSGGKGIMPRRGGRADLSDREVIGAIEYMLGELGE